MDDYRRIADRITADIASGRLRPGQQLPPQRVFARRRGIAGSTAGRVYAELVRRGLVVGEVGRGTFVRAAASAGPYGRALVEPSTAAPVNLELNYPSAPGQSELLAPALAPLLRPDVLTEALRPAPATGTAAAREAVADLLATPVWRPASDRILFTGNARQAIAATLASLVRPGGRVGVEPLTYPLVREIAGRLGVTLVALEADGGGLRPESVRAAHRAGPLSALYLQPTLHNPTSVTTGESRKREIADVVRELGLPCVEDRIWSFLHPDSPAPLAAHAPDLVHAVDGLSKRVAPGLTVGFVVVPEERVDEVAGAIRSGGWSAGRFALEAGVRWMTDGTVARLVEAKRADAGARQRLVAEELAGFTVRADPLTYYAWWELPPPWRADTFTAAATAHGIAVTPGTTFTADPTRSPNAVRLGLASATVPDLRRALRTLAALAGGGAGGTPVSGGRVG
ncbi:PLP-dependent aminotransferase family protein [Streptomyces sp. NBC_00252]|uniref:aminotransferase-like domain-containing protein n=1 Tax=Streptomyces sp. NBC_00252 TaxID=2975691 RepID=UPI002E28A9F5|nr:PLP-dependent aminotransferase family protein [Streptomyces sp. NBC_00252]